MSILVYSILYIYHNAMTIQIDCGKCVSECLSMSLTLNTLSFLIKKNVIRSRRRY